MEGKQALGGASEEDTGKEHLEKQKWRPSQAVLIRVFLGKEKK